MSYKWHNGFMGVIALLASTYGSGVFSTGNYNGTGGAATPTPTPALTPTPTPAPTISIGPVTLPVTGATMALLGALLIAAAAAIGLWLWQRRRARQA